MRAEAVCEFAVRREGEGRGTDFERFDGDHLFVLRQFGEETEQVVFEGGEGFAAGFGRKSGALAQQSEREIVDGASVRAAFDRAEREGLEQSGGIGADDGGLRLLPEGMERIPAFGREPLRRTFEMSAVHCR